MSWSAHATTDPHDAWAAIGAFLRTDPIGHNLIITLLEGAMARRDPVRTWWVLDESGQVGGVAHQWPTKYPATVSRLAPWAPEALAHAVHSTADHDDERLHDPPRRVRGAASDVSRFAAELGAVLGRPVRPSEGQRVLRAEAVIDPVPTVAGGWRASSSADLALLGRWWAAFDIEIGDANLAADEARAMVEAEHARASLWVWEVDGRVVSTARHVPSATTEVRRVGMVYTPPEHRGRGYAAGCVAALTRHLLADGTTPMLWTQTSNPTSNAIYRRIGYEPCGEELIYDI